MSMHTCAVPRPLGQRQLQALYPGATPHCTRASAGLWCMLTSPGRSCSSSLCYSDWAKVTVLGCQTCFNKFPNLLMAYLGWSIIHDSGNILEPRKAIDISTGTSREDVATSLFHYKIQQGHYHPKNIFRDIPEWYKVGHHMNLLPSYQKHDQLSPFFCCLGHKPCYH